mmetsp:Transcript_12609/g.27244  ORF Transcript_12609/g.27244 Transcript_12609/m.27244 type:complete len:555 (+) Transcript_12609:195-1859(+)|eukprot:CAMPEP_0202902624 /NCGR_PEP_ID=MMETSP1392-20130828/16962_1 /ASSEMBLY_ACC=CAM_ASM_000868 /TAXON_ID=225041 /ORGANISM="Chlamydomonas chlamydogama, Strain SAG 11-48b" /LENGTH=554 /DNA_ID=CAMNT_0049589415 /DNA_START=190 /DNA_END=1854 /DNA_ORIENTATION=-
MIVNCRPMPLAGLRRHVSSCPLPQPVRVPPLHRVCRRSPKAESGVVTVQSGNGTTRPFYYRDPVPWPTAEEIPLQPHDLSTHPYVDLIVAGAGPSGVAVAERVAQAGFSVCVVDPNPLSVWPNNYGVWVDEFEAMGLQDCLEVIWSSAKVWLDNDTHGAKFLKRPYGRVDRPKLKRKLLQKCAANGVTFLDGKVDSVSHGSGSSTVKLTDGRTIGGSLVLDATGHVRKLVEFEKKFDPGYQGAYGIIAEVESHPFDVDTMLFMDWRDNHTEGLPDMKKRNEDLPTFLYAMPFSPTKIFLEETSLVSRPAVGFEDLKERLDARLKWLGIKVKKIEEEEYCLIPMGGVLPKHPQRVLGIGGTAGMVHPSTGFMMSRMLGAAPGVADAIIDQLSRPADKASQSGVARRPGSEQEAQAMAEAVWQATWPVARLRQRAFNTFGMDMLLTLNLFQMREFFASFFSLSEFHWHGFLSTRLSFTQLIGFGLALFMNASNSARMNLLKCGIPGLITMLIDIAPTLGNYYPNAKTVKQLKMEQDAKAAALQSQKQLQAVNAGSK